MSSYLIAFVIFLLSAVKFITFYVCRANYIYHILDIAKPQIRSVFQSCNTLTNKNKCAIKDILRNIAFSKKDNIGTIDIYNSHMWNMH